MEYTDRSFGDQRSERADLWVAAIHPPLKEWDSLGRGEREERLGLGAGAAQGLLGEHWDPSEERSPNEARVLRVWRGDLERVEITPREERLKLEFCP